MQSLRVGGRKYSDPDVLALIRASNPPLDPQKEVVRRARELNQRLKAFGGCDFADPRERLEVLASLAGAKVTPMAGSGVGKGRREALVYVGSNGSRQIHYDPSYADGRVNFSIAHEIAHTFFPDTGGARFRSMCADDSKEANELEMLCHRGAAELLMPTEEFLEELSGNMGLTAVPRLCEKFGSSYEATVYRLASAYPGTAVAGLLRFRLRLADARRTRSGNQARLFEFAAHVETPQPRLRRQSLHQSDSAGLEYFIPWNKSFDENSCVYAAANQRGIHSGFESLPNECEQEGNIEAISAPYQRPDTEPGLQDVLFIWWI